MGILSLQTQAQTILNGSFESHPQDLSTSWMPWYNWDQYMECSYAISGFEIWLLTSLNSEITIINLLGNPYDGEWAIAPVSADTIRIIAGDTIPYFKVTAFSLKINNFLSEGEWYKLSFAQRSLSDSLLNNTTINYDGNNNVEIGVSTQEDDFGALIYTSPIVDTTWNLMEVVFQAPTSGIEYITCRVPAKPGIKWALLDDFRLHTDTNAVVGIEQPISAPKKLLRIIDVLGRESEPKPNVPLFYIYDDGTVEKKIVVNY